MYEALKAGSLPQVDLVNRNSDPARQEFNLRVVQAVADPAHLSVEKQVKMLSDSLKATERYLT